jgi:hypothetical protein
MWSQRQLCRSAIGHLNSPFLSSPAILLAFVSKAKMHLKFFGPEESNAKSKEISAAGMSISRRCFLSSFQAQGQVVTRNCPFLNAGINDFILGSSSYRVSYSQDRSNTSVCCHVSAFARRKLEQAHVQQTCITSINPKPHHAHQLHNFPRRPPSSKWATPSICGKTFMSALWRKRQGPLSTLACSNEYLWREHNELSMFIRLR